jgi:hypothetical protein
LPLTDVRFCRRLAKLAQAALQTQPVQAIER